MFYKSELKLKMHILLLWCDCEVDFVYATDILNETYCEEEEKYDMILFRIYCFIATLEPQFIAKLESLW